MKKLIIITVTLLVGLCIILTGCGCQDAEEDDTSTPETISRHYSLDLKYLDDYKGVAILTAYDNEDNVLWKFKSDKYMLTELCNPVDMDEHDGTYYINAGGTIYGIDVEDGSEVWRNEDFNGYVSAYDFDEDGVLYAAGYYGPDLGIINSDGFTERIFTNFESDNESTEQWYWPYKLKIKDDYLIVKYDTGVTVKVDPLTGIGTDISHSDYSDEEYCEMAAAYFEKVNHEAAPAVDVKHNNDGTVTIHIYEDMPDHVATLDWYTVDMKTLKGTDLLGNEIDLHK